MQAVKQYQTPIAGTTEGMPQSFMSSHAPRSIASTSRIVQVASQNGSQAASAGGVLQFNVASSAGYMKSGSLYLRCTVTQTGLATPNTWSFCGPQLSAASIIQRLSLNVGGTSVESINQYGYLHNLFLAHAGSSGYAENDAQVGEYVGQKPAFNESAQVSIPLASGVLNSPNDLPLFLLSGGLNVQIDLAPVSRAIFNSTASTSAPTDFTVTNAVLIYKEVVPDTSVVAKARAELAGRVFSIPFITYRGAQLANASNISQALGLNVSSLRAVMYATVQNPDPAVANSQQQFPLFDGQTAVRCFLDGRLVNSRRLNDIGEAYQEMQRAFHKIADSERSSARPIGDAQSANPTSRLSLNRSTLGAGAFLGAIDCSRDAEAGMIMSGTPTNQVVLEIEKTGVTGLMYIWAVHDAVLGIKGDGVCEVML
jgi:hypothetical protein